MTKQTKKGLLLFSLLTLIIVVTFGYIEYRIVKTTEISDVAEQKSVIDEQAMMLPLGGVCEIVYNSESLNLTKEENETSVVASTAQETVGVIYSDGWVNASVNVRKEPDTDSDILGTLSYNTQISYVKTTKEWSQVQYNDTIAYIKTEYISEEINPTLSPYQELIDSFSEDEKYLLYQITYAEAGNQTMEGQRAVIEVILNRILSEKFPDTLYGVLSQSGQFTTWALRNSVTHNEEQVEALNLVYTEEPVLNTNYLMFSVGQNSWGRNYVKIDDQWFGTF